MTNEHVRTLLKALVHPDNLKKDGRFGAPGDLFIAQNLNIITGNVLNHTIAVVQRDFEQYPTFTIAASYMIKLADSRMEHIWFSDKFVEDLRKRKFPVPSGSLSGFPFLTSKNMTKRIANWFQKKGAIWIGEDDFTERNFQSDRYFIAFVAQKFVAFAVIENIQDNTLNSAVFHKVYLLTFWSRPSFYESGSTVTIAARSRSDLLTICSKINRVTSSQSSNNRLTPTVLILLGSQHCLIDCYLFQLGSMLANDTYNVLYYFKNVELSAAIVRHNFGSLRAAENFYSSMSGEAPFDISTVNRPWMFALMESAKIENLPLDRKREYRMTIPVQEFASHSYDIWRHPTNARSTIWDFSGKLEQYHSVIKNTGFFGNLFAEADGRSHENRVNEQQVQERHQQLH